MPDEAEKRGFRDLDGSMFYSDPTKKDTDGDGLLDNEEVGPALTNRMDVAKAATARGIDSMKMDLGLCYYDVVADPRKKDTDSDFIEDGDEIDEGTNPRKADSDGDGLNDGGEKLWGTDPYNKDSDGDGLDDYYEVTNRHKGYNPLRHDTTVSTALFLNGIEAGAKALKGAACGEVCELNSLPEVTGALAASVFPPTATVTGVRDVFGAAIKGDKVSVAFNAVGLIPMAGIVTKPAKLLSNFVVRHPEQAMDAFHLITTADYIPQAARRELAFGVLETAQKATHFSLFMKHGIKPDTVDRFMQSRYMNLEHLAKTLAECGGCIANDVANYSVGGWMNKPIDAEMFFRGKNARPQALPPPPRQTTDIRYYDSILNEQGIEAKSGFISMSPRIRRQIEKDCKMTQNRIGLPGGISWHFFASNDSNSIGAAESVLKSLRACNIPYKLHMP